MLVLVTQNTPLPPKIRIWAAGVVWCKRADKSVAVRQTRVHWDPFHCLCSAFPAANKTRIRKKIEEQKQESIFLTAVREKYIFNHKATALGSCKFDAFSVADKLSIISNLVWIQKSRVDDSSLCYWTPKRVGLAIQLCWDLICWFYSRMHVSLFFLAPHTHTAISASHV